MTVPEGLLRGIITGSDTRDLQLPAITILTAITLGHYGGHDRVRCFANVLCTEPSIGTVAGIGEVTEILRGEQGQSCRYP